MVRAALLVCAVISAACGRAPDPAAEPPTATASARPTPASAQASAAATATAAPSPGPPFEREGSFDLLITGGTVIDGLGGPGIQADVLVDDGRIVHVGAVAPGVEVGRRIDAKGKVVAPGFIDTHGHGDPEDENQNFVAQGVTTVCLGQDGKSPSDDRIGPWARRVGKKRLAVNAVPFVGHATARGVAKVGRDPTPKELDRLAKVVAEELEAGAFGLTTGLEYPPGAFAPKEELVAIAKPVAESGTLVMSHLRSEDDDKIDAALDELLAQGKAGARVHVSHIKVVYGQGAARAERLLGKIAEARKAGIAITADLYPYDASYTTIGILFPDFAKAGSWKRVKRARREEVASYLRDKVGRRGGPEKTLFGTNPYRGKTLAEVAAAAKRPFEDVLIDDIGPDGASAAYFVMDEAVVARLLIDPHVMIATDGSSVSRHPRGYGTFAKVIDDYVIERRALTLEEAVRKMTSLPAATVGLEDRGVIRPGQAADLVVFDPAAVEDRATYEEPHRPAAGMSWVLVNGVAAVEDGERTKKRGGRVLLRRR
jgi:N-acyl-D-aspartate/D-glutamate deacylase